MYCGAGADRGIATRVQAHPLNHGSLQEFKLKLWVLRACPQNPHKYPWFAPKAKQPIKVCTPQIKILGPPLLWNPFFLSSIHRKWNRMKLLESNRINVHSILNVEDDKWGRDWSYWPIVPRVNLAQTNFKQGLISVPA